MKLRIPSKVAQDIREIIRSNLHGLNFCFRAGSVTRNGFIPELSNWQQKNIREGIEALGVNERVSVSSIFAESCTIGNVLGHDLIFGACIRDQREEVMHPSFAMILPIH